MRIVARFLALSCVAFAQPAAADILPPEMYERWEMEPRDFVCPLGGETFQQATTHPHSWLASYSDGSHLGDNFIEHQIPQCPGNGLLLIPNYSDDEDWDPENISYYQYSESELALLEPLLASPEWVALAEDTRQLRAYWLATQLNLPASTRLTLLMQSPYGAASDQARRSANEAIARDADALIEQAVTTENRYYFHTRVVDALRQLGRFDEAKAKLATIDRTELPEQDVGPGDEGYIDEDYVVDLRGEDEASILTAISQGNVDRFPLVMMEDRDRSRACQNYSSFLYRHSPRIPTDCEPIRAEHVKAFKENPDPFATDEVDELTGAAPDATPSPEEIVARCKDYTGESTGDEAADDALFFQCYAYGEAVDAKVAEQLSVDDRDFGQLCSEERLSMFDGCRIAREIRTDNSATALLADKTALAIRCSETPLYERPLDLVRACYALETNGGVAYWEGYSPLSEDEKPLRDLLAAQASARIEEMLTSLTRSE